MNDVAMNELPGLEPCPGCGHIPTPAQLDDFVHPVTRDRKVWSANCTKDGSGCGWSVLGTDLLDAVNRWNDRPRAEPVWSAAAVAALWRRQGLPETCAAPFHPYTCPNRGDGKHQAIGSDLGMLVPTVHGWLCPFCDYRQGWALRVDVTDEQVVADERADQ